MRMGTSCPLKTLCPSTIPSCGKFDGGSASFDFRNLTLGAAVEETGKWKRLVISSTDITIRRLFSNNLNEKLYISLSRARPVNLFDFSEFISGDENCTNAPSKSWRIC